MGRGWESSRGSPISLRLVAKRTSAPVRLGFSPGHHDCLLRTFRQGTFGPTTRVRPQAESPWRHGQTPRILAPCRRTTGAAGDDAVDAALALGHATLTYGERCFEFTYSVEKSGACFLRLEEVGRLHRDRERQVHASSSRATATAPSSASPRVGTALTGRCCPTSTPGRCRRSGGRCSTTPRAAWSAGSGRPYDDRLAGDDVCDLADARRGGRCRAARMEHTRGRGRGGILLRRPPLPAPRAARRPSSCGGRCSPRERVASSRRVSLRTLQPDRGLRARFAVSKRQTVSPESEAPGCGSTINSRGSPRRGATGAFHRSRCSRSASRRSLTTSANGCSMLTAV